MKRVIGFFFLFFLLVTFLFSLFAVPVSAQDTGWVIDEFSSNIAIQQSGKIKVVETIAVDFNSLEKHGIYRDIPYVYEKENGEREYTTIDVDEVRRDGEKEKYETTRNEGYIRIKIGNADKTISGKHTYDITYEVAGVLRSFEDHDELFWNVTGNYWSVPIVESSAIVTLPGGDILQSKCFEGPQGSSDECLITNTSDRSVTFQASRPLSSYEGLTIVVGYPKGLVPILIVERPKTFFEKFMSWPSLMTLLSVIGFGIMTVLFVWYRNGRDYLFVRKNPLDKPAPIKSGSEGERPLPFGHHETIVVEYTPPENLRPAEIGVLVDERADTLDVVATIIDLATRGYLAITEVPKSWMFGKVDYKLTKKKKDEAGLLQYEKDLLDKLFSSKDEVTISSLKQTFYTKLSEVKKALYDRVVAEKFFPRDPEKIRGIFLLIAIVLIVIGFIGLMNAIGADLVYLADFALGMLVSGVILLIFSPFMSRRTGHGREMLRRVKGYKLFIDSAEKYRQRFFEKKNLFNEVLPYAIMFGLTAKFAQAMKDIGLPEKYMGGGWYAGVHAFNYATFSSSMNSFASSMSTAIASAPKSSGFSSSGGFSGGGGGGGGGGSW